MKKSDEEHGEGDVAEVLVLLVSHANVNKSPADESRTEFTEFLQVEGADARIKFSVNINRVSEG